MFIVVLGAGAVGGEVAQQLGARHLGVPVVLVDARRGVAEGKALDLRQSAPVDGSASDVSGTDDVTVLRDAALIVMADEATARTHESPADATMLPRLQLIARHTARGAVLVATPDADLVIARAVAEYGVTASRLAGSAPEALRGTLRTLIAQEARCRPDDVAAAILGRAPDTIIVPWEGCSIGGRCATDVLTPPAIRRIEQRLPGLWPPGPHALGRAAAQVAAGIWRDPGEMFCVQVALVREGTGQRPGPSAILPARLGRRGVDEVLPVTLTGRDRMRLDSVVSA